MIPSKMPTIAVMATALSLSLASQALAADCHALTGEKFSGAEVLETEMLSSPFSIGSWGTTPGRGVTIETPLCRVRGTIRPTPRSDIRFEVWLPAADKWNGRFQGVGNGGFAGNIAYSAMNWAAAGGYAVAATDTGHVGSSADPSWALGESERIDDLGWRAMHLTAEVGKAIVAAYYGKPAEHAYFAGCSTGGRQGLVLAQRFPNDYDGIVVGAPASNWPRLLAFGAVMYQRIKADPQAWLSPEKLQLINDSSLKTCKGTDGLIDDPGTCHFDPAVLACRPGQVEACLNPGEVSIAQYMYDGLKDSHGNPVYPGFTPGLEKSWGLWNLGRFGSQGRDSLAYPFPTGFYGILFHQDPTWSIDQFQLSEDLPAVLASPVGQAVYAENPDLGPFFRRGGKLIQYHGWQDPAIPAGSSLLYYQSVADHMGGIATIRGSYRLFMGTGMLHCAGGPGPSAIGGASPMPPQRDNEHDVIEAVRSWVEQGKAPDRIVASRYTDNDPRKPIAMQRPWCAWPLFPGFIGGDRTKSSSYSCQIVKLSNSPNVSIHSRPYRQEIQ